MMVACVKITVTRLQNISICSCIEMNTFKTVFLNFVISNVESINIVPHTRHQAPIGHTAFFPVSFPEPAILGKEREAMG